jgi:3-oxoadipate enol-lactonase
VTSQLNYEAGGSGPAVVLIHPVGLDRTTWDEIAPDLETDFNAIRVDLPGFGASPALPKGALVADYASSVVGTMDRMGVERFAVVGASFGGMIAQTIALDFPERVSALIPSACPAGIDKAMASTVAKRGTDAEASGMAAVVEATLIRWFTAPFLAGPRAEEFRNKLLADSVEGWTAAWHAISRFDVRDRLKNVRVPTLCIAGRSDVSAPVAAVQVIADAIPGARLEIIEEAPHMVHIEQRERFARLVRSFLGANLLR